MRLVTFLAVIVVLILWFISATLIAAPSDVQGVLTPGFSLSPQKREVIGIILFLVSMVVITGWAITVPDSDDAETASPTSVTTSPVPA